MLFLFTIFLSATEFFVAMPVLLAFILKPFQFLSRRPTSDTPGSPIVFDNAMKSLFRTLPEPSDFNIIWTSVPLVSSAPLIVRGKRIPGRVNSMTLYHSYKISDVPYSIDLEPYFNDDDEYEIILIKDDTDVSNIPTHPPRNVITCRGWSRCIICFRTYLVPPGVTIETPTLAYFNDQSNLLRPSETYVSGPAYLSEYQKKRNINLIQKMALINLVGGAVMQLFYNCSLPIVLLLLGLAGLLAMLGKQICFAIGKRTIRTMVDKVTNKTNHQFFYPSAEEIATASQPSTLNKYWVMSYDLTKEPNGTEVQIAGQISPEKQKYWSVIVYDEYGLPLSSYVYDESAKRKTKRFDSNGNEVYTYDIRLMSHAASKLEHGVTAIDVSTCRKGFVLFRLVHPTTEDALAFSTPRAQLVTSMSDKKKLE